MKSFYDSHGMPKGRSIGGSFTGPNLDRLLTDDALADLSGVLNEVGIGNGVEIAEYLASLRDYHKLCVTKLLPPEEEWTKVVKNFHDKFDVLQKRDILSFTPKIHVAKSHIPEYFRLTGHSLYTADTSPTESTHSRLRKIEECHGTRTVCNLGTDLHETRLMGGVSRQVWKNLPDNFPAYGDHMTRAAEDIEAGSMEAGPGPPPDCGEVNIISEDRATQDDMRTTDDLLLLGSEDYPYPWSEVAVDVIGDDNKGVAAPIIEVRTEAEAADMIDQGHIVIFGFGSPASTVMETFTRTVARLRKDAAAVAALQVPVDDDTEPLQVEDGGLLFAHSSSEVVMSALGRREGVVMYRPKVFSNLYENRNVTYTGSVEDEHELADWVRHTKHGLVGLRTQTNREDFEVNLILISVEYICLSTTLSTTAAC